MTVQCLQCVCAAYLEVGAKLRGMPSTHGYRGGCQQAALRLKQLGVVIVQVEVIEDVPCVVQWCFRADES